MEKNFNLSREGLKPTPKLQSLAQAIAEGNALLANEAKTPVKPTGCKPSIPVVTNKNPYIQARTNVLNAMTDFNRNEILTMEKEKNTINRWYDDFVRKVATEGDRLSP